MIYYRSLVEVAEIGVEAVQECYKDLAQWAGSKVFSRLEQLNDLVCNYGESED